MGTSTYMYVDSAGKSFVASVCGSKLPNASAITQLVVVL